MSNIRMATLPEILQALMAADPQGRWMPRLFEQLEEVHWGAVRHPGRITAGPGPRVVTLVDGPITLPCVIETDTLLLALEDARSGPLPTGTADDAKRHHVSRCIEALRALAGARTAGDAHATIPLFGVVIVGGADIPEPHRTTILEGLPHIEREQAEDLYASYWGRLAPDALERLAVMPPG